MSSGPFRPLQNRVDPFGDLHAASARGAFMGNRGGRFHRDDRTLGSSRWTSRRWLVCLCEFNGRRLEVWGDRYTQLFFLDEPTALAVGHRPCFECRRVQAKAFLAAFPGAPAKVDAMDRVLHADRLDGRRKRLWRSRLGDLPDGAMVVLDGRPHALSGGKLLPWSFAGYGRPLSGVASLEVDVLTPRATVLAISAGYRPQWEHAVMRAGLTP